MRTTIDLSDELYREAKTRAIQQGTTLKELIAQYIHRGLQAPALDPDSPPSRRGAPPVAIRRIPGQPSTPELSNRQLNDLLEEEEVHASNRSRASTSE